MGKCENGHITDFGVMVCPHVDASPEWGGTGARCGSTKIVRATYQDLVDNGVDEFYAAELTGDLDAARGLMKDYRPVISGGPKT